MTGQELIKKIEEENLQDRHLFIDVEGYISPVCEVLETRSGDIILTQEGRGIDDLYDKDNLERYFSEWFKIIPREEAERKWFLPELDFCVLRRDGSDCSAYCYDTFGEIPEEALFGIEKGKTGGAR